MSKSQKELAVQRRSGTMAVDKGIYCTGCGACERACPVGCIEMAVDSEGFSFPRIEKTTCIDCDRCEKVCPLNNNVIQRPEKAYCYAAKASSILSTSASGGAFSSIARAFVSDGGAVVAVSDDVQKGSSFELVSTGEELSSFAGSKYYQCDLRSSDFVKIESALKQGVCVLFCGTPCQVLAVKNAVPKRLQHGLYLIDIICQGVPSRTSIDAYRREVEKRKGSKLLQHVFRAKVKGEEGHYVSRLSFADGDCCVQVGGDNLFTRAFMYQVSLRESCYQCPFARQERAGDLTLGDYWSESLEEGYVRGSTSLVLENTKKGAELLGRLEGLGRIQEVSLEAATADNIPLHHPVSRPFARSFFYPLMRKFGFMRASKLCCWRYSLKNAIRRCVGSRG